MKTIILLCFLVVTGMTHAAGFQSRWEAQNDAVWIGPEYWANPMEDWKLADGRIECVRSGGNRNVHLLTHQLGEGDGEFTMSVLMGRADAGKGAGSAGFRVGIKSDLGDYRSALLFGKGTNACLTTDGALFIGNGTGKKSSMLSGPLPKAVKLELTLRGGQLTLTARDPASGKVLGTTSTKTPGLSGNVALVNNHAAGSRGAKTGPPSKALFWFSDWALRGDKVEAHPDQAFGPILFAHHSLNGKVMKMTAHLPPVGPKDAKKAVLEIDAGDGWKVLGTASMDPLARTVEFRSERWDSSRDTPYRVRYHWRGEDHEFTGTIRKEPAGRPLVVAGFTGNTDPAFPNAKLAENVGIHDPDLLVFTGDQIYEGVGGYGIHRSPVPLATLNYLRKWWLCGWAFRDLTRDRPALFFPDDHDVYQGNIWGQGGRRVNGMKEHAQGGYAMAHDWVNMVQRTLVSHHPDPHDATPVEQGITVYYGGFTYGGVSFGVIEDRKFKSGPDGKVNDWKGRSDHVKDPNYDVGKLDKPGLVLLGDRQLQFLDSWARDWNRAHLKVVLSQTIFCNLANYHGPGQEFIPADLDSNGWPQTGRRKALESMRRGHAFHLAGDQHLASIVHHGVGTWRDAGYSFCVPSIAAGYPRSWRPDVEDRPIQNRPKGDLPNTGDYKEGLGNHVTVHAVGNPAKKNRKGRLETLHDKASGYGILRLDPDKQTITMECWRLLIDAANPQPGDQFPGWPKTISVADNDGREAVAWLPTLVMKGAKNPVIHVETAAGTHLYSLRVHGERFSPKVYSEGIHKVTVADPESGRETTVELKSQPQPGGEVTVTL